MLIVIGVLLIGLAVATSWEVSRICNECNTHQLWVGFLELHLTLLDRIGVCVGVLGCLCLVLGYIG